MHTLCFKVAIIVHVVVVQPSKETPCVLGKSVLLPGRDGFISNHISRKTWTTSVTCQWRVEASPGQHINTTLINFNHKRDTSDKHNIGLGIIYSEVSKSTYSSATA